MNPAPISAFGMGVIHWFMEYFDFAEFSLWGGEGTKGERDRPTRKEEAGDGELKTP